MKRRRHRRVPGNKDISQLETLGRRHPEKTRRHRRMQSEGLVDDAVQVVDLSQLRIFHDIGRGEDWIEHLAQLPHLVRPLRQVEEDVRQGHGRRVAGQCQLLFADKASQ